VTAQSDPAPDHRSAAFARTGSGSYAVLVAVFCCLLIVSNIAATKGIQFGPVITDGGAFVFPLTYLIGDVLAEVYGLRAVRRTIVTGFAMALVASLVFWLVQISPAVPGYEHQAAFEAVVGVVPVILAASLAGYLVGQFLNAVVLVRIKRRTAERHLWVRLIGSTVVGEFGDTLLFCAIAASAIGIRTPGEFLNYVVVGFAYKTLLEVVLLPITYRVIAAVKRREPSYAAALVEPAGR
jgi:uncharacterized integral membrane protein (TIGR00697 family)